MIEETQKSEDAHDEIFDEIIPETTMYFRYKTGDYDGTFLLLGAMGQFADINRKFWKLYTSVWKGKKLDGEQPEEICQDLIGHLFLLIYCLRHNNRGD